MPDVSIGYEGLSQAATQLQSGQEDLDEKLQSLQSMISTLNEGDFKTQLAAPRFQDSYQEWTSGAKQMLDGLQNMASYLGEVAAKYQELDQDLSASAS
jgi:WXG100 family type VII secretion target